MTPPAPTNGKQTAPVGKQTTPTGKHPVTKIELYRLTSARPDEIGAAILTGETGVTSTSNLWRQAAAVLRGWATTAPVRGHDEVRFVITWADGEVHEGRFMLELTDLGGILFSSLGKDRLDKDRPPEPDKRDHTMLSRHVRCFFDYLVAYFQYMPAAATDVQAFREAHDLDDASI